MRSFASLPALRITWLPCHRRWGSELSATARACPPSNGLASWNGQPINWRWGRPTRRAKLWIKRLIQSFALRVGRPQRQLIGCPFHDANPFDGGHALAVADNSEPQRRWQGSQVILSAGKDAKLLIVRVTPDEKRRPARPDDADGTAAPIECTLTSAGFIQMSDHDDGAICLCRHGRQRRQRLP